MYFKKLQPKSSVDKSEVRDSISRCKSERVVLYTNISRGKNDKITTKKTINDEHAYTDKSG